MTPSPLRAKVVAERAAWIRQMLAGLRALPLGTYAAFEADPRNPAAAESYLRRALEALLDLGRHVLAKGFGRAVIEDKNVATGLAEVAVLDKRMRCFSVSPVRRCSDRRTSNATHIHPGAACHTWRRPPEHPARLLGDPR